MATQFSSMLTAGFKEGRKQFGVDFTKVGAATVYRGVMVSGAEMLTLGIGGFTQDFDRGLQYLSAELTLTNGDKVTIGSTTYRVLRPEGSDDDPVVTVALVGVNK